MYTALRGRLQQYTARLPLQTIMRVLPPCLVVLAIAVFIYFFVTHPHIRQALMTTNPAVLVLIGALYAVYTLCLAWTYEVTLRLCGKRLGGRENILLTCYSTIINFFGPLQSGPGVRAAYLKKKYAVGVGDYTVASLIAYGWYAGISALFILIGSGRHWLVALGVTLAVILGSLAIICIGYRSRMRRAHDSSLTLRPIFILYLGVATLCQLLCMVVIYYVELRAVHTGASLLQALTYGGAANFALFVALTPGAIGFREAFLNFSQAVHHITTPSILAASVIDRAVFVAFLGLLFLLILGMHANKRFTSK